MKKLLSVLFCFLVAGLCGCSAGQTQEVFCVSDTLECVQSPAFYLSADIPQGTFLSTACNEGRCALYTHEDYEIMQEIFYAEDLDAAFRHLTGRSRFELAPICVSSFPQEEYRFAWAAAGEEGALSCCGMLFFDGECYYSLCAFCDEGKEKLHRSEFSAIFAGTELLPV